MPETGILNFIPRKQFWIIEISREFWVLETEFTIFLI
jgi:hypothetical protein